MFDNIRDPAARVRAICQYGCQMDIDTCIPPKRYFRSGLEMIRMANVYLDEDDYESAFVLYSKFITLFVEKLPNHPDYQSATTVDKSINSKKLKTVFPLAETLKQKLTERYEKAEVKRQEEEKKLQAVLAIEEKKKKDEGDRLHKLKEEEFAEETRRRSLRQEEQLIEQQKLLEILKEQEREKLEQERRKQLEEPKNDLSPGAVASDLGTIVIGTTIPDRPPPAYGEIYEEGVAPFSPTTPVIPDRTFKPSAPPVPSVDRSNKPSHFASTGAATENKHNYRDMVIPAILIDRFLEIAQPNTNKKIETCAILSGKVSKNAFNISHLLIPKQTGGPDTCLTEKEEDIFMYQDSKNLITLGWIHTHPTQTAFLSSVDLHTHCSYQQLLPEAIAIVCSPKYNETGLFYLTPNHGLSLISGCRQRGFHEHQKHPPLFEAAGHAKLDPVGTVEVVDLRTL